MFLHRSLRHAIAWWRIAVIGFDFNTFWYAIKKNILCDLIPFIMVTRKTWLYHIRSNLAIYLLSFLDPALDLRIQTSDIENIGWMKWITWKMTPKLCLNGPDKSKWNSDCANILPLLSLQTGSFFILVVRQAKHVKFVLIDLENIEILFEILKICSKSSNDTCPCSSYDRL